MSAIKLVDLKKYYGETKAVDGISLEVSRGEVFGMLGPNGAGKTTTVETIEGLRKPDSGTVEVFGMDVTKKTKAVKEIIGVQLQNTALYPRLTVREVINLFQTFFKGARRSTDELIDMMNLEEKQNTFNQDLSGGQMQRLSVALALINHPKIVFLDEPTTGLDPAARRNMWETVQQIQKEGTTVFMTTHYMEEAEVLCDRVAVVDSGKIIALNSPKQLINEHFSESAIEFETKMEAPPDGTFMALKAVKRTRRDGTRITLYSADIAATLKGLTDLSEQGVIKFNDLHVRKATLEDVFLKLTGRRIRD